MGLPDRITSYLADTSEAPGSDCTEEVDTSPEYKSLGDKFKFCANPRMFVYTSGGAVVNKKAIVHAPGNGAKEISFVRLPHAPATCQSVMFDFKFGEVAGTYTWINRGTEEDAPDGAFIYKLKDEDACLLYKLELPDASALSEVSAPLPDRITSYLADTSEEPGSDCTEEVDTSPAYKSLGDKFKFCANPRMFVYSKGGAVVNKKAIQHVAGDGAQAISFVRLPHAPARCPSVMFDFTFGKIAGSYTWINRGVEEDAPGGAFVYKIKGEDACLLYKFVSG